MTKKKIFYKVNKKVEEKVLRRQQIKKEISEIKEELAYNEDVKKHLLSVKEKLRQIKDSKKKTLLSERKLLRRNFIKNAGLTKFYKAANELEITATIGDFDNMCNTFGKLHDFFYEQQENLEEKKLRNTLCVRYYDELNKCKIQNELMELLKAGKMKNNVLKEKLEEREKLRTKITSIQNNFIQMKKIVIEKEEENNGKETLEDYLDRKLKGLKDEVYTLNAYFRSLCQEHTDLAAVVQAKTDQITDFNKHLKSINEKDVKNSKEYENIKQKNELLKIELETYYELGEDIAKETTVTLNLMQEKSSIIDLQREEFENLQENVNGLKKYYNDQIKLKVEIEDITESIKNEAEISLEHYYRVKETSYRLRVDYDQIKKLYDELKSEKIEIEEETNATARVIQRISNDTREKYQCY